MAYKLILLAMVLLLSGCSTVNRAIQFGAAANDTALESAENMQCNIASIRSVRERYNTPEKRKAYNLLCGLTLAENP